LKVGYLKDENDCCGSRNLNSEKENITHGEDILPFQLDLPHTRVER
jgi:hypothetical protein